MHRRLWLFGMAGLGLGSAAVLGGGAGGELGALAAGYGTLVVGASLYLLAGLAILDRVWRFVDVPRPATTVPADRLAGRRVF